MPNLYGNPVVSGQMIPHGNEALTQTTQVITDQFYAEQKQILKKKAFGVDYSVLPSGTESATVSQVSVRQTNPPAASSRGFFCVGNSIV